jgi:hypothetical protein
MTSKGCPGLRRCPGVSSPTRQTISSAAIIALLITIRISPHAIPAFCHRRTRSILANQPDSVSRVDQLATWRGDKCAADDNALPGEMKYLPLQIPATPKQKRQ